MEGGILQLCGIALGILKIFNNSKHIFLIMNNYATMGKILDARLETTYYFTFDVDYMLDSSRNYVSNTLLLNVLK